MIRAVRPFCSRWPTQKRHVTFYPSLSIARSTKCGITCVEHHVTWSDFLSDHAKKTVQAARRITFQNAPIEKRGRSQTIATTSVEWHPTTRVFIEAMYSLPASDRREQKLLSTTLMLSRLSLCQCFYTTKLTRLSVYLLPVTFKAILSVRPSNLHSCAQAMCLYMNKHLFTTSTIVCLTCLWPWGVLQFVHRSSRDRQPIIVCTAL